MLFPVIPEALQITPDSVLSSQSYSEGYCPGDTPGDSLEDNKSRVGEGGVVDGSPSMQVVETAVSVGMIAHWQPVRRGSCSVEGPGATA